jgi:hypothetical protein
MPHIEVKYVSRIRMNIENISINIVLILIFFGIQIRRKGFHYFNLIKPVFLFHIRPKRALRLLLKEKDKSIKYILIILASIIINYCFKYLSEYYHFISIFTKIKNSIHRFFFNYGNSDILNKTIDYLMQIFDIIIVFLLINLLVVCIGFFIKGFKLKRIYSRLFYIVLLSLTPVLYYVVLYELLGIGVTTGILPFDNLYLKLKVPILIILIILEIYNSVLMVISFKKYFRLKIYISVIILSFGKRLFLAILEMIFLIISFNS